MQGEKEITEYYEGKLLGNNNECPLSLRILTTLQICTAEEMLHVDRAQWFAILFGELEKVPPVEINQPIYRIYSIDSKVYPHKYYIVYGYVSSIRQDKDKKWNFRYSYWFPKRADNPLYPKIRDKSEKDKSLHEVKIDDLYIRGEYKGQMYFVDLEDAQKRLKELYTWKQ
jgi:hypothetical protein